MALLVAERSLWQTPQALIDPTSPRRAIRPDLLDHDGLVPLRQMTALAFRARVGRLLEG
jgi:hypothetical protein